MVGPAAAREGPRAGQPAADPPVRAGQDPGGHGARADLQPAGLDPDAQRAAARPGDPAASTSSCSTCIRPACRSRSPPPACATPCMQAQQMYDPDGRDPAFNRMVLLGHSMGGLLSHMMVGLERRRALAALLGPAVRQRDHRPRRGAARSCSATCSSSRCRSSSRVVFLATPHRGSDLSRGVVGRVGTSLIADPDHIHDLLYQLVKDNPDAFDSRRFRRFPTSIETLDTDSPILTALLKHEAGPGRAVPLDHRVVPPDRRRPEHRRRRALSQLAPTLDGVVVRRRSCVRTTACRRTPRRSSRSTASCSSTSASTRPRPGHPGGPRPRAKPTRCDWSRPRRCGESTSWLAA